MARKAKKISVKAKNERATVKAENFKKLATKRTSSAIGRIRLLKNLANRNSYTYTDAQVKQIIGALQEELNAVQASFSSPTKTEVSSFSLE